MIRISVDWENNNEQWWIAAQNAAPSAFKPLLTPGATEVNVSKAVAAHIRQWAESLPGWDDGPDYAPHPLIFNE